MRITLKWLEDNDACEPGIDRFKSVCKSLQQNSLSITQAIKHCDMAAYKSWLVCHLPFDLAIKHIKMKDADDVASLLLSILACPKNVFKVREFKKLINIIKETNYDKPLSLMGELGVDSYITHYNDTLQDFMNNITSHSYDCSRLKYLIPILPKIKWYIWNPNERSRVARHLIKSSTKMTDKQKEVLVAWFDKL